MAWTDRKIRLLKMFWRSYWTVDAIALALDLTRGAVIGKLYRLRTDEDVDVMMGDLARRLFDASRARPIGLAEAKHLIEMPGYIDGLKQAMARGEFVSPPPPQLSTATN